MVVSPSAIAVGVFAPSSPVSVERLNVLSSRAVQNFLLTPRWRGVMKQTLPVGLTLIEPIF